MLQYSYIDSVTVFGFASSVIILLKTLAVFLKIEKTGHRSHCNRKRIADLRTFVNNCEFFQIIPVMMHARIIGYSGSIWTQRTSTPQ